MISLLEWRPDMEYSFPRYLLSKQSVDDRALNCTVLEALKANIPQAPIEIVEVGAGIGSMLRRLLHWKILPPQVDYSLVDEMVENKAFGTDLLPKWAKLEGYEVEAHAGGGDFHLSKPASTVQAHFVQADVFDYIESHPAQVDLLIAHAFLDLLPLPGSLPKLFSLIKPGGLAWLTINFDGMTTFEPVIDAELDARIEMCFHKTMDERITNGVRSGDSRTGRHLFGYLSQLKAKILAAGASDWVVHPMDGQYPSDEAYFLQFILYFFETTLCGSPELHDEQFAKWLAKRRSQVDAGQLTYIAHQMDFLVRV